MEVYGTENLERSGEVGEQEEWEKGEMYGGRGNGKSGKMEEKCLYICRCVCVCVCVVVWGGLKW